MAVKKKKRKKKNSVVRFGRRHSINVGVIIFVLIFLYVVFYIGMYLSRDKVSFYEVVEGKNAIIANHTYNGFVLRTETPVTAANSGYVNFYVKDGGRVSKTTTVYSLDENGTLSKLLESSDDEDGDSLSSENVGQITYDISQFVSQFDMKTFDSVYDFKYELNSTLLECINLNKLQNINEAGANESVFQLHTSPYSGIVEFYTDGYEGLAPSAESINDDLFDKSKYKKNNVTSGQLIEGGAPVFKVISSEDWYIMIQLTDEEVAQYGDTSSVKLRFLKDNLTTTADFEMFNVNGKYYAKLSLKRYMVRYADYRYLDIQILGTDTVGLKIPKSAVCKKEFYTIPVAFKTTGGNSQSDGFNTPAKLGNGDDTRAFISPDIYYTDEQFCYVDKDDIESGTILINPTDNSQFMVGSSTGKLEGVYNINDGFTDFRIINILAASNDYYIVSSGNRYGVQNFDHIVLDASTVKDKQIVFQ